MKAKILLLIFISCAFSASAQYYNPYNNPYANQQAFEYGRRMAEQMQQQEEANLRRNPTLMMGKMVQLLAYGNDDEKAYEYAEYLAEEKDLVAGWYWLGVLNETGIGTNYSIRYAKTCYQNGARKRNGRICRQRLTELSNGNELDEYTVRQYCKNIVAMGSSVTIPDFGSSSNGSSSGQSSKQSSTCSKCNGTGWDRQRYNNATGTYYYNSPGVTCPVCGYSDKHYHYKCYH